MTLHHSTAASTVLVGTAGWALPRDFRHEFPAGESNLARYAGKLNAAEINSSFYRPHRSQVYERWAASVPANFRFSVKIPKTMTHEHRLAAPGALMTEFMTQVSGLGSKLGCLLVQLPPSLAFDARVARSFTKSLREHYQGPVALEPRHASWFTPPADALLSGARIARVLADPVLHASGTMPGGFSRLVYCRLHGSPRVYFSPYGNAILRALADRIDVARQAGVEVWCIFDNTASGAAAGDALALSARLAFKPAAA